MTGRLVRVLVDEQRPEGLHEIQRTGVDGHDRPVSSGVYYLKMTAPSIDSVRMMTLVR